jgi:DNA-binding PadR family transcriptional regulator
MKHRHRDGSDRRYSHPDEQAHGHSSGRHRHRSHGHGHGHHREGRRDGRPFDYGDLRLVILSMIAEQPRHGYELIKAIEERMAGSYSPSPGVIYPTLAYLEEAGHATVAASDGVRKQYSITPEGQAFLAANRTAVDAVFARMSPTSEGRYTGVPPQIVRGMENLKLALRLRLSRGAIEPTQAEAIAAALDEAAKAVERS